MVVLNKSNNDDKVRLTLTESLTITPIHYKLVFTSRQTKEVVTIDELEDTSAYPERCNKFSIDTATEFENMPEGFWDYKAYDSSNNLLEEGAMKLNPAADFEFTSRVQDNTFKVYEREV